MGGILGSITVWFVLDMKQKKNEWAHFFSLFKSNLKDKIKSQMFDNAKSVTVT